MSHIHTQKIVFHKLQKEPSLYHTHTKLQKEPGLCLTHTHTHTHTHTPCGLTLKARGVDLSDRTSPFGAWGLLAAESLTAWLEQ